MDGITIILVWILLSYPIVRMVNRRMEELNDDTRFRTWFQVFLFIRAQFEVPRYYFSKLINLIK
jgi:hypothetical protein